RLRSGQAWLGTGLFLNRFLRFVPMSRDCGRNDGVPFLQSKLRIYPPKAGFGVHRRTTNHDSPCLQER
ncbi:MAG: hypothetical protein NTX52_09895, partial [Planctomycetota bacterium]|nr:hypothetical protein [Planctomycetota bacterium]